MNIVLPFTQELLHWKWTFPKWFRPESISIFPVLLAFDRNHENRSEETRISGMFAALISETVAAMFFYCWILQADPRM